MDSNIKPQKERSRRVIFRPYYKKNGKIYFPKKSKVFPIWVND